MIATQPNELFVFQVPPSFIFKKSRLDSNKMRTKVMAAKESLTSQFCYFLFPAEDIQIILVSVRSEYLETT